MVNNRLQLTIFYSICCLLGAPLAQAQSIVKSVRPLPAEVNSNAEEIMPLLSTSADTLFFSRVFHEANEGGLYSGSDIWYCSYDKEKAEWSEASNKIRDWNDKRNNFIVGTNLSNAIFYLNHPKSPEKGIQFVKKNGKWTKPETIALQGIPSTGYQGLFVSADYEVILLSMKGDNSFGEEDLYAITKDEKGRWAQPFNLGSTINTGRSEISPFLSADKKKLFFASQGHGGFGNMDIFMAERLYNSWNVWSKPVNLGKEINSEAFDAYYSQYGDTIAFFSSNREGELADLYEVKMEQKNQLTSTIMRVSTSEEIAQRDYFSAEETEKIFGFQTIPTIQLGEQPNIKENNVAKELIWFLTNKLEKMPELKISIKIFVLQKMSPEVMVIESAKIAQHISAQIKKQGINSNRITYDGVALGNSGYSNTDFFSVKFLFFK